VSAIARSLVRRLATSDDFAMSGDFDSLDAREKAALEAALKRCCVLADRIGSILRIERRDFVDKVSLADFYASLEYAANILGTKRPTVGRENTPAPAEKGLQARGHQRHRQLRAIFRLKAMSA
jgi:hypothetical protein